MKATSVTGYNINGKRYEVCYNNDNGITVTIETNDEILARHECVDQLEGAKVARGARLAFQALQNE